MRVKARPIRGTTLHVWNRMKYYPGEVYDVDEELGKTLIRQKIADPVDDPTPVYRGPGRPRKRIV